MSNATSRGIRVCAVQAILIGAIGLGAIRMTNAQANVTPRVRSSHDYIRAMIAEAAQRSPTFDRLIEAIEATDGIVYVEQGACAHSLRACLSLAVTPAGDFRILRVMVDARQPDWEVMASIGHELQHAVEVLGNKTLTSTEMVFLFYTREGMTMGEVFETAVAIRVGNAVRSEVGNYARRRVF